MVIFLDVLQFLTYLSLWRCRFSSLSSLNPYYMHAHLLSPSFCVLIILVSLVFSIYIMITMKTLFTVSNKVEYVFPFHAHSLFFLNWYLSLFLLTWFSLYLKPSLVVYFSSQNIKNVSDILSILSPHATLQEFSDLPPSGPSIF